MLPVEAQELIADQTAFNHMLAAEAPTHWLLRTAAEAAVEAALDHLRNGDSGLPVPTTLGSLVEQFARIAAAAAERSCTRHQAPCQVMTHV